MFDWGKFRNFALVKPKDVHQPLGWQALLTSCEVLRTLSLGIWVLGDGGHQISEERRVKNAGHVFQSKATSGNVWWVLGDGC